MKIEVSNGEIVDKLTILDIKAKHITDSAKLENVEAERTLLAGYVRSIYGSMGSEKGVEDLKQLHTDLLNINQSLWNVEDQLRDFEREEIFGQDFIEAARSVYYLNDERAEVKKKINVLTGSMLVEEKSYQEYKKA